MHPTFCPAPWNGLHVWQDGTISPCCEIKPGLFGHVSDIDEYAKHPLLLQLRESLGAGQRHEACAACWRKESSGGDSSRKIELGIYGQDPRQLEFGTRINIYLSNKCNMRCRMCSEDVSSGWIRDARDPEIESIYAAINGSVHHPGYTHAPWQVDAVVSHVMSRQGDVTIRLRGGEPLYIDENIELIESLASKGLAGRVNLGIITNGSISDEGLWQGLSSFKRLSIGVSIDGTDAVHEYIRGGGIPLQSIMDNMDRLWSLPNIAHRWVATAVSPINLANLAASHANLRSRWPGMEIWYNRIVDPIMMDAAILPIDMKDQILMHMPDEISIMLGGCLSENLDDTDLRRWLFARHTLRLDSLRGQSIRDIAPELAGYLDQWISLR